MSLLFDHAVIVVADLDAAMEDYADLGFTVAPGGEHPVRESRNALVVFGDGAYLELIAFRKPDPDFRWWQVLDRDGEGLVDIALLPEDIEADIVRANAQNLELTGPLAGSRHRPDGERLTWKMARPSRPDLPFLCADVTARALRVPEGEVRRHANGAVGVAEIGIAVRDPQDSARRWEALLGKPARKDDASRILTVGSTTVRLFGPTAGPDVARAIDQRGEGPITLELSSTAPDEAVLDRRKTHGVAIALRPRES